MARRTYGKSIPIRDGRRLVLEYMRHSRDIPLVTVRREFTIPALVIARAEYSPKLSWVARFAKAFALAAIRHPHLRRNWLSFPVGRIYEHPNSECIVLVEREWQGEEAVLGAKLRAPESMNLATIDGHIRRFKNDPVLSVSPFRQLLRVARYPALLRRFLFWLTLNCSGYKRCERLRHVRDFQPRQSWMRTAHARSAAHELPDFWANLSRRRSCRLSDVRSSRHGWPARGTGSGRHGSNSKFDVGNGGAPGVRASSR